MTTHHTSGAADLPEALYADAVKFAKERASISYVQRKCRCSYNKAERMLEQMVADGIIQTYNGRKDAALTARAISAEPAAHVQNPAENEHVADDMSKNETGSNTAYASHGQAPAQPDLGTLNGLAKQYADSYASPHHFTLGVNGLRQIIQRALPQPAQQAPAGASAEPYGWLYDWTHSSATSRADTTYTGFTKDEAHARKHDNCLAIFTAPQPAPSTDSVQEDAARLDWLDQNIFHREMGEWDAKYGGLGNYNMWVMFAPKGAQGSARNILDAARKQGGSHD